MFSADGQRDRQTDVTKLIVAPKNVCAVYARYFVQCYTAHYLIKVLILSS